MLDTFLLKHVSEENERMAKMNSSFKFRRTIAFFMALIISILPIAHNLQLVYAQPASTQMDIGVMDSLLVPIATTTPPALQAGGVDFIRFPNFEDVCNVNPNSTVNFHVHAAITPATRNANFVELRYEWLRNGEVWTGPRGPGSTSPSVELSRIPARDIVNPGFAGIRLQLQGPMTHAERGGEWQLRVFTIGQGDTVLFVDYTHTITLAVGMPCGGDGDDDNDCDGDCDCDDNNDCDADCDCDADNDCDADCDCDGDSDCGSDCNCDVDNNCDDDCDCDGDNDCDADCDCDSNGDGS